MRHSMQITREDNNETLFITSNIVGNGGDNVRLFAEKKDNGKYCVKEIPITVYDHKEKEPGMISISADVIRMDTDEEFLITINKSEHNERFDVLQITDKEARPIPIDIGFIMASKQHNKNNDIPCYYVTSAAIAEILSKLKPMTQRYKRSIIKNPETLKFYLKENFGIEIDGLENKEGH